MLVNHQLHYLSLPTAKMVVLGVELIVNSGTVPAPVSTTSYDMLVLLQEMKEEYGIFGNHFVYFREV